MKPILNSALRTDFYNLTMGQAVLSQSHDIEVRYELFVRSKVDFPPGFAELLREQILALSELKATQNEIQYLREKASFLAPFYLEWLSDYSFNPDEVFIEQKAGLLTLIVEGPWYRTIYWEVPLMAMVCELYFRLSGESIDPSWLVRATDKARILYEQGINWADFSMRRAQATIFNEVALREAMKYLKKDGRPGGLVGTSCVSLAVELGLNLIGTMGHQMAIVYGATHGCQIANTMVMQVWMKEFKGKLGTILPDTFTTDVFLRYFTSEYAKAFDGARHDSEDPIIFAQKFINHYLALGIDPLTKTLIFSDSLDLATILIIAAFCKGKIQCSFGWGGGFYGVELGVAPLNIAFKPIAARLDKTHPWLPAVKLATGKVTNQEVANAVRLILAI